MSDKKTQQELKAEYDEWLNHWFQIKDNPKYTNCYKTKIQDKLMILKYEYEKEKTKNE